jgi:hypothetical protein
MPENEHMESVHQDSARQETGVEQKEKEKIEISFTKEELEKIDRFATDDISMRNIFEAQKHGGINQEGHSLEFTYVVLRDVIRPKVKEALGQEDNDWTKKS